MVKQGKEFLVIGMTLDRDDFKATRFDKFDVSLPTEKWSANPFVGDKVTCSSQKPNAER
jgi:hypothetical protein